MWSPFSSRSVTFISSCNGLLCFEYYANKFGSDQWVVWEPSTNELQVIPQPQTSVCLYKECVTTVGHRGGSLHFDSQSGDYKLFDFLIIYYPQERFECTCKITQHAMVYSVKNNVWKEVPYPRSEEAGREGPVTGEGMGICVNGVCYWSGVGVGRCKTDYSWVISYDFVTEEFSKIKCPSFRGVCATLVEMDGSVAGQIFLKKADLSSSSQDGFVVDVEPYQRPLWFGKRHGGYYLLLEGPHGELREYDYTRKRFNSICQKIFPRSGPVPGKYNLGSYVRRFRPTSSDQLCKYNYYQGGDQMYQPYTYETKTAKNNANIWHNSSFHAVEVQDRFSVYASECDQ